MFNAVYRRTRQQFNISFYLVFSELPTHAIGDGLGFLLNRFKFFNFFLVNFN